MKYFAIIIFLLTVQVQLSAQDFIDWYKGDFLTPPMAKIENSSGKSYDLVEQLRVNDLLGILCYQLNNSFLSLGKEEVKKVNEFILNKDLVIDVSNTNEATSGLNGWGYNDDNVYINPSSVVKGTKIDYGTLAKKLLVTFLAMPQGENITASEIGKLKSLVDTYTSSSLYNTSSFDKMASYRRDYINWSVPLAFDGIWESNYGDITFIQNTSIYKATNKNYLNQNIVEAFYDKPELGKLLNGKVILNDEGGFRFVGEWLRKHTSENGVAKFDLSDDRLFFKGFWVGEDGEAYDWIARKKLTDLNKMLGNWDTNYGKLTLIETVNGGVKGFYEVEGVKKTLEGVFVKESGKDLKFHGQWGTDGQLDQSGGVEFTYDEDDDTINGRWHSDGMNAKWYDWTGKRFND